MKHLPIYLNLILLVNIYTASAQSTITYYDQNGLPFGKAEIKPEPTYKPQAYQGSEYISSLPPLELINTIGQAKQQLYDKRVEWLQNRINAFGKMITTLQHVSQSTALNYSKSLESYVSKINDGHFDLSDNRIFQRLANEIDDLHRNAYNDYVSAYSKPRTVPIERMLKVDPENPAKYLQTSWGYAEQDLNANGHVTEKGITEKGLPFISYDIDDEKYSTLYYKDLRCFKYMLQAPYKDKDKVVYELDRLYKKIPIATNAQITYSGMWLDTSLNIRWSLEIQDEEGNNLIIRATKL